jgi:predicted  nucleic acid-binding Zn-ribbon protein
MKRNLEEIAMIEEQLYEAQNALFRAKTVREAKFLQNKIEYLRKRAKELGLI